MIKSQSLSGLFGYQNCQSDYSLLAIKFSSESCKLFVLEYLRMESKTINLLMIKNKFSKSKSFSKALAFDVKWYLMPKTTLVNNFSQYCICPRVTFVMHSMQSCIMFTQNINIAALCGVVVVGVVPLAEQVKLVSQCFRWFSGFFLSAVA